MPAVLRRTVTVLATSAVCVLGAVTAADAAPPGLSGPTITLVKTSQQAKFAPASFGATADAAGNAYISWVADSTPGTASRVISLCTLKLQKTACSGGVQTVASGDPVQAGYLYLLPGSKSVTLVWQANSPGGAKILKSVSQAGGPLSSPADIAAGPANGTLFDAVTGPSGHIWTVTGDDAGNSLQVEAEGSSPPLPKAPWPAGFAELGFSGSTAVLVIQQAGTISTPVSYASLTGGKWSAFRALTGTWSDGYAPGLTSTAAGLRLVTSNSSGRPVVASWHGSAFSAAKAIGDSGSCGPNSAQTTTDASGRLADVTNECGAITVDNLPGTTRAAIVRFTPAGTIAGSTPQIATLPSGRSWAVYAVQQDQSPYDELIAAPLLLPALRTHATSTAAAGSATVTGPASCLPVVDTPVGVSAAAASGWHLVSTSLTLDGKSQPATLQGASLTPGKSYTLAGAAKFAEGSKSQSVTASLSFTACPAP